MLRYLIFKDSKLQYVSDYKFSEIIHEYYRAQTISEKWLL